MPQSYSIDLKNVHMYSPVPSRYRALVRRFERHEENAFWELEHRGSAYTVRWGQIGTAGDSRTEPVDSEQAAVDALDTLVGDLEERGFIEQTATKQPTVLQWNDALGADLFDEQRVRVYADWLEERGNPLGRFIASQLAGSIDDELIAAHFTELFGADAARFRRLRFNRTRGLRITFERGFVDSIWCGRGHAVEARAALASVLASPASRRVRNITLAATRGNGQPNAQPLIGEVVAQHPEHLQRLEVGDFSHPSEFELHATPTGDVSKIWRALPSLREVVARGKRLAFGEIVAPELRSFTYETARLDSRAMQAIITARWPNLEALSLGFERASLDAFEPILQARGLSALRQLALHSSSHTDDLVQLLVHSPLLKQLTSLDLSNSLLTWHGLATLIEHADAFRHLQRLKLSGNPLATNAERAALDAGLRCVP